MICPKQTNNVKYCFYHLIAWCELKSQIKMNNYSDFFCLCQTLNLLIMLKKTKKRPKFDF